MLVRVCSTLIVERQNGTIKIRTSVAPGSRYPGLLKNPDIVVWFLVFSPFHIVEQDAIFLDARLPTL
jgi:hypothetical protein